MDGMNRAGDDLVAADPELARGLNDLPGTHEAGMHDEAVAGADPARFAAILGQFRNAGKNDTNLEGLALDRAIGAGRRFPYAGANNAVSGLGDVPGQELRVSLDEPVGRGLTLARLGQVVLVDESEVRHGQ